MPQALKPLEILLGGLSYCKTNLPEIAKRIRPITPLLNQGVNFVFTPAMETIVRKILKELSVPPFLVYPDWETVADSCRLFLLYYDASIDGFGGTLEHELKDGSIRPIVFFNRAIVEAERYWAPFCS